MIFCWHNKRFGGHSVALAWLGGLLLLSVGTFAPPVQAQTAPKTIKFTLVFTRIGAYQCYPIIGGRRGEGIAIAPGEKELPVEVSSTIEGIEVLDEVSGLVATLSTRRLKRRKKIDVSPEDFDKLQKVTVRLLSKNGEPAAKGVIRLTPKTGEPLQYGLTTMDGGSVSFENVALGKAQIKAYGNTGDDAVRKTVIIAATVGGRGQDITLTLPLDVATVKPTPAPTPVGAKPDKPEPAKNDWTSGILGLAILGAGGFFGLRFLKQRNMTPQEGFAFLLTRLGVDAPGANVPGSEHAGLRPTVPDVVQTPLPALSDLPDAGVAVSAVLTEPVRALPGTHLIGLAGAVAGQNIPMTPDESMVSVGRDTKCTIPLPNDSMVSRRHAVFAANGAGWDLMDEASTNGTFLNGKRIENRTALMTGDEIQIGMARFRFVGEKRPTGKAMEA
ncbi:MAG: FHA domain-containing protein [Armatimonadetes bacterium]|nr:FHA domain-containing protein [Armatimonadota bacterium]